MKRLISILALAVGAWFAFPYVTDHFAVDDPPTKRLSQYVDGNVNRILGPINSASPSIDTHSIRQIREDIKDEAREADPSEARMYNSAILLCDTLLQAAEERSASVERIRQIRAETGPGSLAHKAPGEVHDRIKFFTGGIERVWNDKARRYRTIAGQYYTVLREEERALEERAQ